MPIGSVDWIARGMLQPELRRAGDHLLEFDVRNQFFHGAHPLGWIRDIQVAVDGESATDVSVILRGQAVPLGLVRTTADIWWYPREIATLRFHLDGDVLDAQPAVSCRFELSTFFFTPMIDHADRYPTMTLHLSEPLTLDLGDVA